MEDDQATAMLRAENAMLRLLIEEALTLLRDDPRHQQLCEMVEQRVSLVVG